MKKKKQGYRKSFRTKKRKSIFKSRLFWIILLILALSAGLCYLFVFSPIFQIKEIKTAGNFKTSPEEIIEITEKHIKTKILFLSSESIFFDGFYQMREEIKKSFPIISKITVKRNLPSTLEVRVEERIPAATWVFQEDNFFIDKEGIVFEETEESKKPVVKGSREVSLGEEAVGKKLLKDILEISSELSDEGIEIREFSISYPKVIIKTEEGWEAYFDSEGNISVQASNLVLVLKEEISRPERKDLEYIDLRFPEKIFYKALRN